MTARLKKSSIIIERRSHWFLRRHDAASMRSKGVGASARRRTAAGDVANDHCMPVGAEREALGEITTPSRHRRAYR